MWCLRYGVGVLYLFPLFLLLVSNMNPTSWVSEWLSTSLHTTWCAWYKCCISGGRKTKPNSKGILSAPRRSSKASSSSWILMTSDAKVKGKQWEDDEVWVVAITSLISCSTPSSVVGCSLSRSYGSVANSCHAFTCCLACLICCSNKDPA